MFYFFLSALLILVGEAHGAFRSTDRCVTPEAIERELRRLESQAEDWATDGGNTCDGRLTLSSGTPITISDVSGATAIYFTPHLGSKISLYDGSQWKLLGFSEVSLALGTLTSDRNYDVFAYNNGGTVALELSAAWNVDGVTRTDAITLLNGIYVKSGSSTRRYIGTIRTTSTTTTEDSRARRFVWNQCNQSPRMLVGNIPTATWSYASTSAWRASGGNTTDGQGRIAFVTGLAGEVMASAFQLSDSSANSASVTTLALDSLTETVSARGQPSAASTRLFNQAHYYGAVAAGYHYFQAIEVCIGAGPAANVFYGTGAGANFHALTGELRG